MVAIKYYLPVGALFTVLTYNKQRRMLLVALPFITGCNVGDVRVGTLKSKHVSLPSESCDDAAHK